MSTTTAETNRRRTNYQHSETELVHRSQIKNAPYNPRTIDQEAERLLGESIRENKWVGTPVWNRRTGNLVGGHQRLHQIDQLEGTVDYWIEVTPVDLSEAEEMRLNLALNAADAQGKWDKTKLAGIVEALRAKEMTVGTGFSEGKLKNLLASASKIREDQQAKRERALEQVEVDVEAPRPTQLQVTVVFDDEDQLAAFFSVLGVSGTSGSIPAHVILPCLTN